MTYAFASPIQRVCEHPGCKEPGVHNTDAPASRGTRFAFWCAAHCPQCKGAAA